MKSIAAVYQTVIHCLLRRFLMRVMFMRRIRNPRFFTGSRVVVSFRRLKEDIGSVVRGGGLGLELRCANAKVALFSVLQRRKQMMVCQLLTTPIPLLHRVVTLMIKLDPPLGVSTNHIW